jgi:hypothetical protein
LPLCNNTTIIRKKQMTTCRVVTKYTMQTLSIATRLPGAKLEW